MKIIVLQMRHKRRCIVQLWTQGSSCFALQYSLLIVYAYLKGKGMYTNVFIEISCKYTYVGVASDKATQYSCLSYRNLGVSNYMVPSVFTESYNIQKKRMLVQTVCETWHNGTKDTEILQ